LFLSKEFNFPLLEVGVSTKRTKKKEEARKKKKKRENQSLDQGGFLRCLDFVQRKVFECFSRTLDARL